MRQRGADIAQPRRIREPIRKTMSLQAEREAVASDEGAIIGEHVGETDDGGQRYGRHERTGEAHVPPGCSSHANQSPLPPPWHDPLARQACDDPRVSAELVRRQYRTDRGPRSHVASNSEAY